MATKKVGNLEPPQTESEWGYETTLTPCWKILLKKGEGTTKDIQQGVKQYINKYNKTLIISLSGAQAIQTAIALLGT